MSLNLGDLVGYIKLDDTGFDSVLDKLPGKMQGSGAALMGVTTIVGAGVAAALIGGMNDAMSFEATNDMVAAQLGLTAVESARVGTLAGSVYAQNYGESVEQVQQTIGGVVTQIQGMGTASDKAVEGMTAKVLNYSSAFGGETSDAISQVQQLISSGLAPDAEKAMDLMTVAMQKVPEALRGDMTDAIGEYGPLMAGLGFSGEEAFDLLARGAEKGMYGIDKAGDAVKEFGIRATDMSAASKVGYDMLGMSQEEMSAKLLAGGDTAKGAFDQIIGGLNGMTDPVAQSQAALALFGTPLEDLGVTEIPAFLGSLTDLGGGFAEVGGAAENMGTTMAQGTAAKLETFNRSLELLMANIGEQLLPVFSTFLTFITENEWVLQALVLVVGILAIAFVGLSIATWAMNTALLANPITWVVLGIMALIAVVVLLLLNWETVWGAVVAIWEGFSSWFMGVLDAFLGWWNGLWTAVWEGIVSIWTGFTAWVEARFLQFLAFMVGVGASIAAWWNGLWTGVGAFLSAAWNLYWSTISTAFNNVVNFLKQTGANIASWWNGLWSGIGAFLSGAWATMSGAVSGAFNAIFNFLRGVGSAIAGWWSGLWSGISALVATVWNGITSTISGVVSGIVGFLHSAFGGLVGFLAGIWSNVSSGISSAWGGILSYIGGLPGQILSSLGNLGSLLLGAGKNIIDGLYNGIKGAAGKVLDFIGGMAADIAGAFAGVLGIHSPSRVFEDFGINTVQGYLRGLDRLQGTLDTRMEAVVQAPEVASLGAQRTAAASTTTNTERNFTYIAAENQSLDAEESLFAALGSPRAKG